MQNLAQFGTHSQSRRRPDFVHWLLLLIVTGQRELINWPTIKNASLVTKERLPEVDSWGYSLLLCSHSRSGPALSWLSKAITIFLFLCLHSYMSLRSDVQDTLFYTTFELDDTRFLQFENKNSIKTSLCGLALLSAWAKSIDTRWESFLTECIVTHLSDPASVFREQWCGSPDAGRQIFKRWLQTGLWYGLPQWLHCSRVQDEQSG